MKSFEEKHPSPESLAPELFMERFKVSLPEATHMAAQAAAERLFVNGEYQVTMSRPHFAGSWPPMVHLSILRLDGNPIAGWDDLQAIKNELVGEDHEAIEIFPAEERLVNMGNNRHLWVFADPTFRIPMGWNRRMVKGE